MNYFELFGIPVQLQTDRAALHRRFIELSRQYHPDYHGHADAAKQAEVLETSATLNRAYRVLQSPDETMKYVLQMKGLLEEEEKYELSPDFLMEVLEINEQLMDADGPEARKGLLAAVDQLQMESYEPVKEMVEHYQEDRVSKEGLLQVKAYYYKKKYLDRIRRQLTGKP